MKRCSIRISVLSIVFPLVLLVFTTGTKAETQGGPKKNLVSELHIESVSLGSKSHSVDGKDPKSNALPAALIPLKEGLNAFIDFPSPFHQGVLAQDDARTNYRAVVGFRFTLR
jgi:hypothetical protein